MTARMLSNGEIIEHYSFPGRDCHEHNTKNQGYLYAKKEAVF
jgi:hypothetical protein